jgi:hypothetical protein
LAVERIGRRLTRAEPETLTRILDGLGHIVGD